AGDVGQVASDGERFQQIRKSSRYVVEHAGERFARQSVSVRQKCCASISQRIQYDGLNHAIRLAVDNRYSSLPDIIAAFALGQRTRIVGSMLRQELCHVDFTAVGGNAYAVRLEANVVDRADHDVRSGIND